MVEVKEEEGLIEYVLKDRRCEPETFLLEVEPGVLGERNILSPLGDNVDAGFNTLEVEEVPGFSPLGIFENLGVTPAFKVCSWDGGEVTTGI